MNDSQLGHVANWVGGVSFSPSEKVEPFSEDSIVCFTTKNVQEDLDDSSIIAIPKTKVKRKEQVVQKGDILVSTANSWNLVGKCCWTPQLRYKATLGAFISLLRPNPTQVFPRYLYYWMSSSKTQELLRHMGRQTTNISNIDKNRALALEIPIPPLPEQERIAALLDKADRLRRLRRYALQLGDSYLQSVFLEMFGDPRINQHGFPVAKFGDVCDSHLGKMLDAKQQTGKHKRPYLRNVNVQWNEIDITDLAEMDFDEKDRKKYQLNYGDVLICEGGEVGRAAIWRNELPECYFQKALHRAVPKPNLAKSEFIVWLMYSLAELGGLSDFTSQVTIAHLTGVKMKIIEFPLPPLALQEKFAKVVLRYERLRSQQRESLRQAEHLFESLLALSFDEGSAFEGRV